MVDDTCDRNYRRFSVLSMYNITLSISRKVLSVPPISSNNIDKVFALLSPLKIRLKDLQSSLGIHDALATDVRRDDHVLHVPKLAI